MDIKTQTRRSTNFKEDVLNLNCFVEKGFECGFVTSKYWGDFDGRKEPLIEIEVEGIKYNIPLSKFKEFIKKHLKSWINWDYTK